MAAHCRVDWNSFIIVIHTSDGIRDQVFIVVIVRN